MTTADNADKLPKAPSNHGGINSRSLMIANEARADKVAERRKKVAQMLALGFQKSEIAQQLSISYMTLTRDIQELDKLTQLDAIASLGTRIMRSTTVRRSVQKRAWGVHDRTQDQHVNKVASLGVILQAQDGIDKLEGTSAPDHLNAAATAEMFKVMMETVGEVGGQALQAQVMTRLAQRLRGSSASIVAGALESPIVDVTPSQPSYVDPQYDEDEDTGEDAEEIE
jgi:hypothetical protein